MLKNRKGLKLVALLTIMLMSICVLTGCQKNENNKDNKENNEALCEEPIKNAIEGLTEGNSEKFLKAYPDFISETIKDVYTNENIGVMLEYMKEEYGDGLNVTYEITEKEEISSDDLSKVEENLKLRYDKEISITKGYVLNVNMNTKGADKEEKENEKYKVYEIDGNWYLLD
ncbi:MAG: hypothetical protein IJ890_05280 [Clostridia bacterium]|nr:hypothetical protein [Clostridia bacterium]